MKNLRALVGVLACPSGYALTSLSHSIMVEVCSRSNLLFTPEFETVLQVR